MSSRKIVTLSSLVATLAACIVSLALLPSKEHATTRQTISGLAVLLVFWGYWNAEAETERQMAIDAQLARAEEERKLLAEATRPVLVEEARKNAEVASQYRRKLHELNAGAGFANVARKIHPQWVNQQLAQSSTNSNEATENEQAVEEKSEEVRAKKKVDAKQKLLKLIQEHEGGWIAQLMVKPILIYGDMGSFKSFFAAFLALCRYYLFGHQIVSITDPHFHQNCDEAWKYLVALGVPGYGTHQNYAEVGQQLEEMYARFSIRTLKDDPLTSIWDEVTNYSLYKECEQPAKMLLRKTSSDPRKSKESPIMIGHDITLVAWGGSEGFSKSRDRMIQLELFSDSDQKPLFRGKLSGIKTDSGEFVESQTVSIAADWIRPDYVYNLFNNLVEIEAEIKNELLPVENSQTDENPKVVEPIDIIERLNRDYNTQLTVEEYLLAESTDEQIEELLKKKYPYKYHQVSEVPPPDTGRAAEREPEPLPEKEDTESLATEIIAKCFPKESEKRLFGKIETYFKISKAPSEIIRKGLKCSKGKGSNRSYSEVGIPIFCLLIRKYGSSEMLSQFATFLEKYSK